MIREIVLIFLFGATAYSFIELAFRGRTHWTMTMTGGAVLLIIYALNAKMQPTNLVFRCFVGCMIITVIEFCVGYVVNVRLKMNIWDYTSQYFNVMGQICPKFTMAWFLLCIPADIFCGYLRNVLFKG